MHSTLTRPPSDRDAVTRGPAARPDIGDARCRRVVPGPQPRRRAPAGPAVRPPSPAVRSGTACRSGSGRPPVMRRPRPAGRGVAVLVGAALAVIAWAVVVAGGVTAGAPPEVTGTSVVHVRSGESLSGLAERIAPGVPSGQVLADIRDLNHMAGSALTAGQPLLAPRYR